MGASLDGLVSTYGTPSTDQSRSGFALRSWGVSCRRGGGRRSYNCNCSPVCLRGFCHRDLCPHNGRIGRDGIWGDNKRRNNTYFVSSTLT